MSKSDKKQQPPKRNVAEWVSLVISLLLLVAVVGTVVTLWVSSTNSPARFRVERGEVRSEGDLFYLPVTIINEGDLTAAQVSVEGTLNQETATTTFDFVPGRSREAGVLIFGSDPTNASVRVVSYQEP